jgi:hypothetical protein
MSRVAPREPGPRLVKVLVVYQMIKSRFLRGLVRAVEDQLPLPQALGGTVKRNTLANALAQTDLELMIEAWILVLATYQPWVARLGQKFARVAVVDATQIKLSLHAFAWAEEAATQWGDQTLGGFGLGPRPLVLRAGKVHDLQAAAAFNWVAHWTYIFDRGYVSFAFLTEILEASAHFVIRFKAGINYCVVHSFAVPLQPASAGLTLLSDEHVTFPNWEGVIWRLVSYRLPDGKLMRVLTDRFDLTALSVAQLDKERWTIEICQTQPVKMAWCPLRQVRATMTYLRGRFKRERVEDVDLIPGDHDLADQALGDRLSLLKRELLQIVTQELTKTLGVFNDLLPVNRLLLAAR